MDIWPSWLTDQLGPKGLVGENNKEFCKTNLENAQINLPDKNNYMDYKNIWNSLTNHKKNCKKLLKISITGPP